MDRYKSLILVLVLVVLGWLTYFYRYSQPPYFYWDENYHVAHAQKYLNGVFFMEPHPPLGKLLIALGEALVQANHRNDQFVWTDHAPTTPPGFSFSGYRLIPALLAWFSVPLMFWIFLELLDGRPVWAFFLTLPYVFDNALIVHMRGAMLEGPQLFFLSLCTLLFLRLLKNPEHMVLSSIALGAAFGAMVAVKVNGLIAVLIFPLLLARFRRRFVRALAPLALSACAVYFGAWAAHFHLGRTINPKLPKAGFYEASSEYREALETGRISILRDFSLMLRDSYRFMAIYQRGVPRLNLCKQEENGSPAFLWPVGARTINYRWERSGDKVRYLYLISNPAGWLLSLLGVLACCGFALAHLLRGLPLRKKGLTLTLLAMWFGYMLAMMNLSRVMYLYHYFIPLLIGWWLLGLALAETDRVGALILSESHKLIGLLGASVLVIFCFYYFSPFTYYHPMDSEEVKDRSWLSTWDLHCTGCSRTDELAVPLCDPNVKAFPGLVLSGIRAETAFQQWGDPRQNLTADGGSILVGGKEYGHAFGVHAKSILPFRVNSGFAEFRASVGVPDQVPRGGQASVRFSVKGDGRELWRSPILHAGDLPLPVMVPVNGVDTLELQVDDGGDGNTNDHAVWLEPELVKR